MPVDTKGEELTIGELISRIGGSIQTGPFGTKLKASEYSIDGVPVISVGEVGHGRVRVREDTRRVNEAVTSRMPEYLLRPGDIVFGRKGAVERSAQIRAEQAGYFLGSDGIRLRIPDDACDPRFIAYSLQARSHREWMIQHAAGSTMPSLNEDIIRRIPITLPSISKQRRIAEILTAMDDRIEVNQRMAETLEEMARAVFRSWFVDFDPVRAKVAAKAEGRDPERAAMAALSGKSEVELDALPVETLASLAAFFPEELEETEMGEVPKGWSVRPLDSIAKYLNGLAMQKYPPNESGAIPVIKIAQLKKGDTEGADQAAADLPSDYIVENGDMLFSWSGSLVVDIWCGGRGALNQHLFKVSSDEFPKWFYYYWTKEHLEHFQAVAAAKAVTMGHIQRHHLTQALCVVPVGEQAIGGMSRVMAPLIRKQVACRLESIKLTMLRDLLLPKLLSGVCDLSHVAGSLR